MFPFTGPTERKFLQNIEDLVRAGLPFAKVKEYYDDREMAEFSPQQALLLCGSPEGIVLCCLRLNYDSLRFSQVPRGILDGLRVTEL